MNALGSVKKRALLNNHWRSRVLVAHACQAFISLRPCLKSQVLSSMEPVEDYSKWSPDKLIERVLFLERQLREQTTRCEKLRCDHSSRQTKLTSLLCLRSRKSLRAESTRSLSVSSPRIPRQFDWAKYTTRLVALKFAYLGRNYHGYEKQSSQSTRRPLPTIEDVLWKAMMKAHLIRPEANPRIDKDEVNFEGCEYSKCGRTDRGVSAFGQVIGIRLRSNLLPSPSPGAEEDLQGDNPGLGAEMEEARSADSENLSQSAHDEDVTPSSSNVQDPNLARICPVNDEIPYAQILNRLLPPDIRILAWCPSPPPEFHARFSCRERRYKYFFTQPAFTPTHGISGFKKRTSVPEDGNPRREGWLDIEAMRDAAKKFEGLHDFRNFCKVDVGKQSESFERRIFYAGVEELPRDSGPAGYVNLPGYQERQNPISNGVFNDSTGALDLPTPKIYTFTLHGSGFLWHQVRYMVAILFLIGQGLESPDLIDTLLDISQTPEKPIYDMADDAPLVLWDCIFPREGGNPHEDGLDWIYAGDHPSVDTYNIINRVSPAIEQRWVGAKHGSGGVMDELWKVWRGRKIDEVLAGRLLDVVAGQGNSNPASSPSIDDASIEYKKPSGGGNSQKVFSGGDASRPVGRYVPVLAKPRRARVEVLNARYAAREGFEQDQDQGLQEREQGFRRVMMRRGPSTGDEGETQIFT